MNRTDRLFAIVKALETAGSRGRTASSLAERFEVSARTIKRDVAALVETGVQVVSQDGRGGGYQLSHAELAPLRFSASEASAVLIALAADPQLPFSVDGEAAFQKLLSVLTRPQRREVEELAARVWMRPRGAPRRSRAARTLDEGFRRSVQTLIDYTDGQGRVSKRRRIEPMAFARTKHHWHVLAWCHLRKAGRWFRIDRISVARLTKIPFAKRDLGEVFGAPPDDARPVSLQR